MAVRCLVEREDALVLPTLDVRVSCRPRLGRPSALKLPDQVPVELTAQYAAAVAVVANLNLRISQLTSGSGLSPQDGWAKYGRQAARAHKEPQAPLAHQ